MILRVAFFTALTKAVRSAFAGGQTSMPVRRLQAHLNPNPYACHLRFTCCAERRAAILSDAPRQLHPPAPARSTWAIVEEQQETGWIRVRANWLWLPTEYMEPVAPVPSGAQPHDLVLTGAMVAGGLLPLTFVPQSVPPVLATLAASVLSKTQQAGAGGGGSVRPGDVLAAIDGQRLSAETSAAEATVLVAAAAAGRPNGCRLRFVRFAPISAEAAAAAAVAAAAAATPHPSPKPSAVAEGAGAGCAAPVKQHHGSPAPGSMCEKSWEPITDEGTEANYAEYQTQPSMCWHAARITHHEIDKLLHCQLEEYLSSAHAAPRGHSSQSLPLPPLLRMSAVTCRA